MSATLQRQLVDTTFGQIQCRVAGNGPPIALRLMKDNLDEALDTLNSAMVHYDAHYAAQTQFKQPLMVSTVTLQRVIGMASKTFGKKRRLLGFKELAMTAPAQPLRHTPTSPLLAFIPPHIFSGVKPTHTIAREEIFGPVIVLIPYEDDADAVRIANDTVYGLAGYVSSADPGRARAVARQIRTGMVHLNGTSLDSKSPFGGYKQSGNGREFGAHGLREFLEAKSIYGDGS